MALTLNETNVTVNETFNEMLEDIQGNILKHHGREVAYHLFVRFKASKISDVKKWIKGFSTEKLVSGKKQLLDAQTRRLDNKFDGGTFYGISLSFKGYTKLGVPNNIIPTDPQFRAGMQSSLSQAKLSDDINKWEANLKADIDAIIIVSDSKKARATTSKNKIVTELRPLADMVHEQKGEVLRNEHSIGIEHFGYVDGVSQPVFLKDEIDELSSNTVWDDSATLNLALVKDKGGKTPDSFGSYLVFRKLDQNVFEFKDVEKKLSKLFNSGSGIKDRNGVTNDELAGAMMVGRFEDGSEVVLNSNEKGITMPQQLTNDFNYGSDSTATRCPFHAHIRITNPRADVGIPFAKSVRLVRRGIPYNDINRNVKKLETDRPKKGVGLLFMCYQANISSQFEFIQSSWANQGNIGGHMVGQDGIIGQGQNTTLRQLPDQWGTANGLQSVNSFQGFVTNKGGEYFFTPCISFLKSL
jgi:Dyp-type peroxidase family